MHEERRQNCGFGKPLRRAQEAADSARRPPALAPRQLVVAVLKHVVGVSLAYPVVRQPRVTGDGAGARLQAQHPHRQFESVQLPRITALRYTHVVTM